MTNSEDVFNFHQKFRVPMANQPSLLDQAAQTFRVNFLKEELQEFETAYAGRDIAGCGDALIDLVYIAMGTAHMMGLPWQEMWDRVQEANMSKQLAKPDGSDSKRGNPLDVIKPPGWVGPDHSTLELFPAPVFDATAAVQSMAAERRRCE